MLSANVEEGDGGELTLKKELKEKSVELIDEMLFRSQSDGRISCLVLSEEE